MQSDEATAPLHRLGYFYNEEPDDTESKQVRVVSKFPVVVIEFNNFVLWRVLV